MCLPSERFGGLLVRIYYLPWVLFWGAARLDENATQYATDVQLRLVQANIAQHHKWKPELQMQGMQKHIALMRKPGIEKITHVIWPETAVPYTIEEDSALVEMLSLMLPADTHLITGALRTEGTGDDWKIFNSVVMLDSSGKFAGQYDKNRLVPFGEFLPFRSVIPKGLTTPVGSKDFSRGVGALRLDWPGLAGVVPLICYEAIFPEFVSGVQKRPRVMLNLTQ